MPENACYILKVCGTIEGHTVYMTLSAAQKAADQYAWVQIIPSDFYGNPL